MLLRFDVPSRTKRTTRVPVCMYIHREFRLASARRVDRSENLNASRKAFIDTWTMKALAFFLTLTPVDSMISSPVASIKSNDLKHWRCPTCYRRGTTGSFYLFLVVTVICCSGTDALYRPSTKIRPAEFHPDTSSTILLRLRGGSARSNNEPIELNPDYQHYVPPPKKLAKNEHELWLQQQQQQQKKKQQQQQYHSQQATFTLARSKETSLVGRIQGYFVSLHQVSPSLFWTILTCLGVFGMWQTPQFTTRPNSIVYRWWFVNTHENAKRTLGLSLILSSLSHISPYHLLVNLVTLSQLGPSARQLLRQSRRIRPRPSWKYELWPLLASSAAFSNALFLLGQRKGASSLGLSGVTMALLAIQARAYPERQYGIVLGVIPISLRAKYLVQLLILVSAIGSWSSLPWHRMGANKNDIAHLAHLGGLVYGLLYYEMVILGRSPQHVVQRMVSALRRRC